MRKSHLTNPADFIIVNGKMEKKRSTPPLAGRENVPSAERTFEQQRAEGSFGIGRLNRSGAVYRTSGPGVK